MRYLSRLVVALQISIRLRSLDSDEKKMQFAVSCKNSGLSLVVWFFAIHTFGDHKLH